MSIRCGREAGETVKNRLGGVLEEKLNPFLALGILVIVTWKLRSQLHRPKTVISLCMADISQEARQMVHKKPHCPEKLVPELLQ